MARSYPETQCPVATALDAIGERWTILILRDLMLNPSRRFQDLLDSLTGCAPNTLSARLKSLEERGLIERRLYAEHPPRLEYLLTPKGRGAAPVLKALRAWGRQIQAAQER
jgi:DNA-binding HxlR family transcriptional regulator